jgi:tetratricopeptide (TPR) repeat protein
VALKPRATSYSNLGSLYYLQGKYKEAALWYRKAVDAISTDSSYWGNLADAYRWTPELSSKAPETYRKAVLFGQRELTGNVRNSHLRSRMAYYYAVIGDKDSASREIAEALRLSGDDGYVQFQAALVYEQLHNRDGAIKAIQAAVHAGFSAEQILKAPSLESLRTDSRFRSLPGPKLSN